VGKYIGDGIMAFWNSPDDVEDHAAAACSAALAQQARLELLRADWTARG
jgi:adenylate cyclase